jgi:hypothetical protein
LRVPLDLGVCLPKGKQRYLSVVQTWQHWNALQSLSDTKEDHLHRIPCRIDLLFKFKMVIQKIHKLLFCMERKSGHALFTRLIAKESMSHHPHYSIWSWGWDCSYITSAALYKILRQSLNWLATLSSKIISMGDESIFWPPVHCQFLV